MNLIEGLQAEANKRRAFIGELERTAVLLGKGSADADPGLRISKSFSETQISMIDSAIASNDVVEMLWVYEFVRGDAD